VKRILIVEDTELNIDLLVQLLEEDYELLVARDGAEGVAIAERERPDLILMDISLPVMDGYEATRMIRTTQPLVPIIGLSAHAMQGDAERARAVGCTHYMTKPVDEQRLIENLEAYLGPRSG
jgi:CheY-like chemotaxis protein